MAGFIGFGNWFHSNAQSTDFINCPGTDMEPLLLGSTSTTAIVDQILPQGNRLRVRYAGSWWFARCLRPASLTQGSQVRVVGRENLTLLIEPIGLSACNC